MLLTIVYVHFHPFIHYCTEQVFEVSKSDVDSKITWTGKRKASEQKCKPLSLNVDERLDNAFKKRKVGRPPKSQLKSIPVIKPEPEIDEISYLSRRASLFRDKHGKPLPIEYITTKIAEESFHLMDQGIFCPTCCCCAGLKGSNGKIYYLPGHSRGSRAKRPNCENVLYSLKEQKKVCIYVRMDHFGGS